MKKSMLLLVLFGLSFVCGVTDLYAGDLGFGANVPTHMTQINDLDGRISRIDEKIVRLDIMFGKESDNKKVQAEKKALVEERASLVEARKLILNLWKAQAQLSDASISGNTKFFVFDAPDGTEETLADFQAHEYGKKFVKDFEADNVKTLTSILQLNKAVDDLLNQKRYNVVSLKEKAKCKQTISEVEVQMVEMFSKGLAGMKLEYVGIRKSLRDTDWMVFRLSQQLGDLSYLMISYSSNEDQSFRLGKLFAPNAGDFTENILLSSIKKLLDTRAGISNNHYSIPASQCSTILDAFVNGDFKAIVKFFNEHPDHLWKNKIYDGNYVNALQMMYANDWNEEIGKKLKVAVEQFRKRYPDNILPDISLLSLLLNKGDKDGYKRCLDHIREAVIDDPALWWYESFYYAIHSDFENAVVYLKKAFKKGYSNTEAYQYILEVFKQNNASSENKKAIEDIIDKTKGAIPRFSPNA